MSGDARSSRKYVQKSALRLGARVPEDLLGDDPELDLYHPVVALWANLGTHWVLSPHNMLHAVGYVATPYRAAPLCGVPSGTYGIVLYSRLTARCPACRKLASLPRVEDVEPRWRVDA